MQLFRVITLATSIMLLVLTRAHHKAGGLIYGFHKDGSTWYSNELFSSGGDDSFLITIGFGAFVISLLIYLVNQKPKSTTYYVNLVFVYLTLSLVNMDVSIKNSILYGDSILLMLIIVAHIPAIYHIGSKLTELIEIGKSRY